MDTNRLPDLEQYRKRLMDHCRSLLQNDQDAEDAVQEIFCRVLAARETPQNLAAWVYRVAHNTCYETLRKRARRGPGAPLPSESRLPAHQTGNLSRLVKNERKERFAALFSALPPEEREALWLRDVEDFARADIAYVQGVPDSVVKSRLASARRMLREHQSVAGDQ